MKTIDATRRVVERYRERYYAREITSFEQLNKLNNKAEVAIMNNCDMVIGRIMYREKDWILIDVVTDTVSVKQDSFKHGNFMYEIL